MIRSCLQLANQFCRVEWMIPKETAELKGHCLSTKVLFSSFNILVIFIVTCSSAIAFETTPIFPTPARIEFNDGSYPIDSTTVIVVPSGNHELRWVSNFLASELGMAMNAEDNKLQVINEAGWENQKKPVVFLGTNDYGDLANTLTGDAAMLLSDEDGAYVIKVGKGGAAVLGHNAQGVYYGCLSLLQLFELTGKHTGKFPFTTIVDSPYHYYRGMRVTLPRGKPREKEISHEYFRNFLRLLSYLKLNHVWVQGTSWSVPLRRHPEMAWKDVLTPNQAKEFNDFGTRHFLSMDGSLDWSWLYYNYKHLAELYPDETWEQMRPSVKKMSRVNPCPSKPETWGILLETIDDVIAVLSGSHFAIPLDEMYQENHGSRWAVDLDCKGKDPVRLWADFANRLTAHVIARGKVPIISGGMLLREHQGWYKNIYKAIDLIQNRDKIVIYNWSEGHIRRGGMVVKGQKLQKQGMKTTPFFREHGYKDVMHLLMNRWKGRPELREVNGKLDCYGGFVSYYHTMDFKTLQEKGTLESLVFSSQHLWSPDQPQMDSPEDFRLTRYGEELAAGVLHSQSFIAAVMKARAAYRNPQDVIDEKTISRVFESTDLMLDLTGGGSGRQISGEMHVSLPLEEGNPGRTYLLFTLKGSVETEKDLTVFINNHEVDLGAAIFRECGDSRCYKIDVPTGWINFGSKSNVLIFVRKSLTGFKILQAAVGINDDF